MASTILPLTDESIILNYVLNITKRLIIIQYLASLPCMFGMHTFINALTFLTKCASTLPETFCIIEDVND